MKKVIGVIFLSTIFFATTVFGAYPAELENAELEKIEEGNFIELTENQLKEAEQFIEEPAEILYSNELINYKDSNEVEDSDLYEIGEEVTISKKVNGNVYAMGEKVDLDGTLIQGNAFVIGKDVAIKNVQIDGSLYVVGENVEISGVVNDIYVCGSSVVIDKNANIWRDIRIMASEAKIDGTIGRNAFAVVGELTVGENSLITGTLDYISTNEAEISSDARIENVNFQKQEIEENEEVVNRFNLMSYVFDVLATLFKTFIISLIIVLLVNKFSKLQRTEKVANELLKNIGVGALVLFLAPILSIVLLFTGVATGLGIIALLLYFVVLYSASSIASVEIATRVLNKVKKDEDVKNGMKIGTSVLVALGLYFVGLIPIVGGIVKFAFLLIGFGILFDLVFKKV